MPQHPISDPASFPVRQPVLEAMSSLKGRWKVVNNGQSLEVDLPLSNYSPHERDVIEFALDPHYTAKNIFHGLDPDAKKALATAIYKIFG